MIDPSLHLQFKNEHIALLGNATFLDRGGIIYPEDVDGGLLGYPRTSAAIGVQSVQSFD
jgi:hypothetical protein